MLARMQHMYFFGASVTTVCFFFFVIGRVLTRLDTALRLRAWRMYLRPSVYGPSLNGGENV